MTSRTTSHRLLIVAALLGVALAMQTAFSAAPGVRRAAQAGAFYPARRAELLRDVTGYLRDARPKVPGVAAGARPRALVVPHAGYVYSGRTAAIAYKLLEGAPPPSRIILLGPSHNARLPGVSSVGRFSHYETPIGKVPVDLEAVDRLLRYGPFRSARRAHDQEHCLEVQVPFLQVLWPETPPIVPILVGQLKPGECRAVAAAVTEILDEDALLLISTDFTHYGARFGYTPFAPGHGPELADSIRELDMEGVRLVEQRDAAGFHAYLADKRPTICGRLPVAVLTEMLSGCESTKGVFLEWANSGAVTRRYDDCVSYVAMAFYVPPEGVAEMQEALSGELRARPEEAETGEAPADLSAEAKRALLSITRHSIEAALRGEAPGPVRADDLPPVLLEQRGAFVTLKKDGELRGCIGHMSSDKALHECVQEIALLAAFGDRRFPPLLADELGEITIEISVLTPMREIEGIDDVRVGRDGLVVHAGRRRGVLLPQVAEEYGWSDLVFLQQTCNKAGLPPDAWQWPETTVYAFSAVVFGEEDFTAD